MAGLGYGEKNSRRAYVSRTAPDSCQKRAVQHLRSAPIADISVPCARRQRSERKRVHSISKEKGGPKPPKHKVSCGIPARAFMSYRT